MKLLRLGCSKVVWKKGIIRIKILFWVGRPQQILSSDDDQVLFPRRRECWLLLNKGLRPVSWNLGMFFGYLFLRCFLFLRGNFYFQLFWSDVSKKKSCSCCLVDFFSRRQPSWEYFLSFGKLFVLFLLQRMLPFCPKSSNVDVSTKKKFCGYLPTFFVFSLFFYLKRFLRTNENFFTMIAFCCPMLIWHCTSDLRKVLFFSESWNNFENCVLILNHREKVR